MTDYIKKNAINLTFSLCLLCITGFAGFLFSTIQANAAQIAESNAEIAVIKKTMLNNDDALEMLKELSTITNQLAAVQPVNKAMGERLDRMENNIQTQIIKVERRLERLEDKLSGV